MDKAEGNKRRMAEKREAVTASDDCDKDKEDNELDDHQKLKKGKIS